MQSDNIKGIIFDLDGVIVFTDKFHYMAWKVIADKLGVYFDETINQRLRGVSRMESLDIILEKYEDNLTSEEKEKIASEKNTVYRKMLSEMTPDDVSEEVRITLDALKRKGILLAIGSSSKNAKYILEKVDLINEFDAISDGTNISNSKPDPEVFLKAAEYLDLHPEQCAVVEDAVAGIDAAIAGNMVAIGIGDAANYCRTQVKINSFSELLKF